MTIDARNTWQTTQLPTTISVCYTWQTQLSISSLNVYCTESKISDLREYTICNPRQGQFCLCLRYPVVRRYVPVSLHTPGVD